MLKKADKTTNRDTSRKQPHNGKPSGSQQVTRDSEDNARQLSDEDGSYGNPTLDVEDHKFFDIAECFKLSEEGETFNEKVFS